MHDLPRLPTSPIPMVQAGRAACEALLGLVYPPRCVGCGARLVEEQVPLCHRCLHRLERAEATEIDTLLARLPEARDTIDGAFVLWLFDAGGTVQRVQHLLKYGNRPRIGLALGALMAVPYRHSNAVLPDLILPIPLFRTRRYERGYNQSAMLALGLGRTLGVPTSETVLVRGRATRSQTHLSRRRRWENVADAFTVTTPDAVAGRRILLIDDVLTTGATLAAAAAVLRRASAAAIHTATLALTRS